MSLYTVTHTVQYKMIHYINQPGTNEDIHTYIHTYISDDAGSALRESKGSTYRAVSNLEHVESIQKEETLGNKILYAQKKNIPSKRKVADVTSPAL